MDKIKIMVCVTQQKTCERLILEGAKLRSKNEDKLCVIHVVNEDEKFLDNVNDGEALEYLFNVSKNAGADLTVLRSKDTLKTMINFAKENQVSHIVMGASTNTSQKDENYNIETKLKEALQGVEFVIL